MRQGEVEGIVEHGDERRGYDEREGKRAESKPKAAVFKGMVRTFRCVMAAA